jgi:hypothetical protein
MIRKNQLGNGQAVALKAMLEAARELPDLC